jgi:hypothetical protein
MSAWYCDCWEAVCAGRETANARVAKDAKLRQGKADAESADDTVVRGGVERDEVRFKLWGL